MRPPALQLSCIVVVDTGMLHGSCFTDFKTRLILVQSQGLIFKSADIHLPIGCILEVDALF